MSEEFKAQNLRTLSPKTLSSSTLIHSTSCKRRHFVPTRSYRCGFCAVIALPLTVKEEIESKEREQNSCNKDKQEQIPRTTESISKRNWDDAMTILKLGI